MNKDDKILQFLYTNKLGLFLLKSIVIKPWFSKFLCRKYYTKASVRKIPEFARKHDINIADMTLDLKVHPNGEFSSFNDFFSRRELRDIQVENGVFPAISDSHLSLFTIRNNMELTIKGSKYRLEELVGDRVDKSYEEGLCLVFRLSINDYHRYIFFDNGSLNNRKSIQGELHTVRDIAQKEKVFAKNKRVVNYLDTDNFSQAIQIEIGALLVGDIINHNINEFRQMQEKGYFSYCGSTIVVLLQKDKLNLDSKYKEILDSDREIYVRMGERIGRC